MVSRKRGRHELEADAVSHSAPAPSSLDRLRSMWEFAALAQYLFTFGKAVRLEDEVDVEVAPKFLRATEACPMQLGF